MNEVMEDDGSRAPWLEINHKDFKDEDFREPAVSSQTTYLTPLEEKDSEIAVLRGGLEFKDATIKNLRESLAGCKAEIASLKEKMQDMRRSIFRPSQARDDEELALLQTEKAALEQKVAGLESQNGQMANVVDHLARVTRSINRVRTTSNTDFNTLVQKRVKQCTDILFVKNKEYSSDTDRLHNFKVAAQFLGCHPITALKGMMVKHEVSIFDMCCAVIEGGQPPSYILMDEKFGDVHNYLFLLEALMEEYRDAV